MRGAIPEDLLKDCQFVQFTGHQCQYALKIEDLKFKCSWKHKCPHQGEKSHSDTIKTEKNPF
jgi:hypothetical protein